MEKIQLFVSRCVGGRNASSMRWRQHLRYVVVMKGILCCKAVVTSPQNRPIPLSIAARVKRMFDFKVKQFIPANQNIRGKAYFEVNLRDANKESWPSHSAGIKRGLDTDMLVTFTVFVALLISSLTAALVGSWEISTFSANFFTFQPNVFFFTIINICR